MTEHAQTQVPAQVTAQVPAPLACVCCGAKRPRRFALVEGIAYFQCRKCDAIFADPVLLARLDRGEPVREYDEAYWQAELTSARQRSYGVSLARMAEVFYYCRRPIERFLDIGTGPGYFLDAVARHLPSRAAAFWGVEKFPPPPAHRTRAPNYVIGDLADLECGPFDAGLCMEVIEHLTPAMLDGLLRSLARLSRPQSAFIFNTGLAEYVRREDRAYLDPFRRGHVIAWSLRALRPLAERHGFTVLPIRGKTWAFVLEHASQASRSENVSDRVWKPVASNLEMLCDPEGGELLKVLGMDTIRAYARN